MTGLGLDFGFGEQAHGVPRAKKLKLVVDQKPLEPLVEGATAPLSPSDLEDKQLSMLNDLRSQYVKARWWERKKIHKAIAALTKELGMQDMVLDVQAKSTAREAKKMAGRAKISLLETISPEKAAKERQKNQQVDEARARELLEKIKETMGGDVNQPTTPTVLYGEPKAPTPEPETIAPPRKNLNLAINLKPGMGRGIPQPNQGEKIIAKIKDVSTAFTQLFRRKPKIEEVGLEELAEDVGHQEQEEAERVMETIENIHPDIQNEVVPPVISKEERWKKPELVLASEVNVPAPAPEPLAPAPKEAKIDPLIQAILYTNLEDKNIDELKAIKIKAKKFLVPGISAKEIGSLKEMLSEIEELIAEKKQEMVKKLAIEEIWTEEDEKVLNQLLKTIEKCKKNIAKYDKMKAALKANK